MTDTPAPPQNSASREGTSQKDLPPPFDHPGVPNIDSTDDLLTVMAQAEMRRLTLQSEAAINLGIGYVLWQFGGNKITVDPELLKHFTQHYRVTGELIDGKACITVTKRLNPQGE